MSRLSICIAIALSCIFLLSISPAQQLATTAVPSLIRYGGTLRDAAGFPIAAPAGVTFAIYKQQDGGAPVWMETQNVTPDTSGLYSVLLGSTTPTGLPRDLFSQQEQRWLGVQVQGQAEQPRVLLVSVPYAMKAHEAETLGGKSISDFVLAKDLSTSSPVAGVSARGAAPGATSGAGSDKSPSKLAYDLDPIDVRGSTTDQIVKVTQWGTGNALVATTATSAVSNGVLAGIGGPGVAVFGQAYSTSAQTYGVEGSSASSSGVGVAGLAYAGTGGTYGVAGYSSSNEGTGMRAVATSRSGGTYGLSAAVMSRDGTAVWGWNQAFDGGTGIWGQATSVGVRGQADGITGTGVYAVESAQSSITYGVHSVVESPQGTAAWLQNTVGGPLILATTGPTRSSVIKFSVEGSGNGFFAGNLNVGGTLTKGGGSFKIDHPLDPENKYLSHSFVESPDMMNIYNGSIRLNARGEAWVAMPDYFDALNRDFQYVLTPVGCSQPRLYIAREIKGNRFKIAGGKPNGKVSWMVTGIRQDARANAHRILVEEDKPEPERGTYLHPELFTASSDKSLNARLQQ